MRAMQAIKRFGPDLMLIALFVVALVFVLRWMAPAEQRPTHAHAAARGPGAREKPYQASIRSVIFHRKGCRWAKKISDRNLLGYDTPEDCLADGLRPCKVCRPGRPATRPGH